MNGCEGELSIKVQHLDWRVAYARPLVMQYIKYCSMDWCPGINMNINDAVLYIVAFFNYIDAFSLLRLTELTLTGFQESCKSLSRFRVSFYHLERILWQTMKVFHSDSPFFHFTTLIPHYYFYKNKRKVYHNTLETSTRIFFWIQWC